MPLFAIHFSPRPVEQNSKVRMNANSQPLCLKRVKLDQNRYFISLPPRRSVAKFDHWGGQLFLVTETQKWA